MSVDFVPEEPGEHLVHIKKRRRPVENSPYKVMVEEPTEQGPGVGKPCETSFPAEGLNLPKNLLELCCTLKNPDGTEAPIDVKAGPNDTLFINFTPKQPGKHLVHVEKGKDLLMAVLLKLWFHMHQERNSRDQKLVVHVRFHCLQKNLIFTEISPNFMVSLTDLMEQKNLLMSELDLMIHFWSTSLQNSLVSISSTSRKEKDLLMVVLLKLQFHPHQRIKPEEPEISRLCEALLPAKSLNLPKDLPELCGILDRLDGTEEPVDIKATLNDTLSISFTPKQPGKHLLHIKLGRRPIGCSPFEIMVSPASKDKPEEPEVVRPCEVLLPAKSLNLIKDLPELHGILDRPDGTEEPVDVKAGPNNTLSINFTPKQPGKHFLHIKNERRPIDESPFEIMVSPASEETPELQKVGKPCEASLPAKGLNLPKDLHELHSTLERPDGTEEPVNVKAGPNVTLSVNFTPKQPGKHLLHIKKERRPIDGSPFEITVSPASKDKPEGPEFGKPCEASLPAKSLNLPKDLPELHGTLERPDGTEQPVDVKAGPNDTLLINFTPKQPGKQLLHIKKGRRPIDESPFEIMVSSVSEEIPQGPEEGKPCEASLPT